MCQQPAAGVNHLRFAAHLSTGVALAGEVDGEGVTAEGDGFPCEGMQVLKYRSGVGCATCL